MNPSLSEQALLAEIVKNTWLKYREGKVSEAMVRAAIQDLVEGCS